MIGCRTVQDRLPEYAAWRTVPDGERIAAHLARCARCAAAHRDVTVVFARLAAVPDIPVPVHGEPNARLALRTAMAGERTLQRPRRRVAGAARSRRDGPRPVLAAVGTAGLVTVLGLTVVWWIARPMSQRWVNGHPMAAVDPSPQPPPRSGEGEPVPSLSRARAGHSHGYGHPRVPSSSVSPLRVGEGPGEGSAAVEDHRDPPARSGADLAELLSAIGTARRWVLVSPSEQEDVEQQVRRAVPVRDDFVRLPFPLLAAASDRQIVAAVESYKREAAIVDPRLACDVTLQQKATALSDLCDLLRSDTGIQLTAGQSVADEKVTLFCEKLPLRDVMRQLSRPFGYAWLRGGKQGEYRYELAQDLRSQLLEEELRNRDRNAALLALEREIDRYRPCRDLSPDEALARARTAPPAEKPFLENLAGWGWGPIQMYFRLSQSDLAALHAGQALMVSAEPQTGERTLPRDVARGVLQSLRDWRILKEDRGFGDTTDLTDPRGLILTTVPEVRAWIKLEMTQRELGQLALHGLSGFFTRSDLPRNTKILTGVGDEILAVGTSPATLDPENSKAHARLARDPALRARITVLPQPSCGWNLSPSPSPKRGGVTGPRDGIPPPKGPDGHDSGEAAGKLPLPASGRGLGGEVTPPKVTTADVLDALHRATGMPIVSDYYTRLYKPEAVSVRNLPLFDALNQLADAMRLRWEKEGSWLQFRSTSFYDDRLKEVPNHLLTRWATSRRQHGTLTLDDLMEIAQLADAQLDAREMAEGAKACFGLAEWDVVCYKSIRPDLRYVATLTPAQRQEAMSGAGLAFSRMSLTQQQQYIARAFPFGSDHPLQSLEELAGAALRVEYTVPGWFQWADNSQSSYTRWVVPLEPGPQGRRVLRPVVRERTREGTLQAVRRVDPSIREALLRAMRRKDPRVEDTPRAAEEEQILPTQLGLAIAYIPGRTNGPGIWVVYGENREGAGD